MTHQRLREKADNAVQEILRAALCMGHSRSGNETANHKTALAKAKEDYLSAMSEIQSELEAARKDAERWKVVRDGRGPGLRLITWDPKAHEELQVMFPSQKLCDEYADDAIDAALNADREK